MLSQFASSLSLSWVLFARSIGAKYRRSFLGYFWMVAPTLVVSVGAYVAHSSGLLQPGVTVLPYALFVFIGTFLWQSFAESATLAHQAVEGARSFLTRVQFPREAIVLAHTYELLFVTIIRAGIALIFMAIAGVLTVYGAAIVLMCAVSAVFLGLGFSMLIMPFTILFSDFHHTIRLLLGYGIFLTSAMYIPSSDSVLAVIVRYNPVCPLMQAARDGASGATLSTPGEFVFVIGMALLSTILGIVFVRIATPIVVERMLIGGK